MNSDHLNAALTAVFVFILCLAVPEADCESINGKNPASDEASESGPLIVSQTPGSGYATIQQAVNAAGPGDTVLVKDGIYRENILIDKPLVLRSENGHGHVAIVAQNPGLPVVHVTSRSLAPIHLQGLSLYSEAGGVTPWMQADAGTACQVEDIHFGWEYRAGGTAEIQATPGAVQLGDAVTLSWRCEHALRCTIDPAIGDVDTQGSMTVYPEHPTIYTVTAVTPAARVTSSAGVDILASRSLTVYEYDSKGQLIGSTTAGCP
jgi:hypothetical protein